MCETDRSSARIMSHIGAAGTERLPKEAAKASTAGVGVVA